MEDMSAVLDDNLLNKGIMKGHSRNAGFLNTLHLRKNTSARFRRQRKIVIGLSSRSSSEIRGPHRVAGTPSAWMVRNAGGITVPVLLPYIGRWRIQRSTGYL